MSSRRTVRRQSGTLVQRRKMTISPSKHTNCSFGSVLLLFTLVTAVPPVAASTCIGTVVELGNTEAVLACPLTTYDNKIKRNFAVQYLATEDSFPEFPMTCMWELGSMPNCKSHSHFEMLDLQPHQVLFKVPKDLKSGSYRGQLVPPDKHKPSVHCHIYSSNESEATPSVAPTPDPAITAAVTTTKGHLAGKRTRMDQAGGLFVAITALSCLLLIQLLIIGGVTFIWFKRNCPVTRRTRYISQHCSNIPARQWTEPAVRKLIPSPLYPEQEARYTREAELEPEAIYTPEHVEIPTRATPPSSGSVVNKNNNNNNKQTNKQNKVAVYPSYQPERTCNDRRLKEQNYS